MALTIEILMKCQVSMLVFQQCVFSISTDVAFGVSRKIPIYRRASQQTSGVKCRAERKLRASRDGNFLVGPKKAVRLRII